MTYTTKLWKNRINMIMIMLDVVQLNISQLGNRSMSLKGN